jgi:hypothetical protein
MERRYAVSERVKTMVASPRISNAAAIAALNALTALLDAGSGPGYVEIREGAPPATLEDAATGDLLATLTLSDPAFPTAVDADPGAIATASAITGDTSADTTGTAGWFRAYDTNATPIIQGTCGTAAADMILNTTSIVEAVAVVINSWTITLPEA